MNMMQKNLKNKIQNNMQKNLQNNTQKNLQKNAQKNIQYNTQKNTQNDLDETFAQGVCCYKLVWIFLAGCIIGYVVEMVYCLVVHGYIESKQGLLYGPFSQIYGFGAVLMTLVLVPLSKKSAAVIFIGSAILGGAFEFTCSFVQEVVFGTQSWDFSERLMSIQGRTSLLFMFFWGILGVFFIKVIYERLSKRVERIPINKGKVITWVIVICFCSNMMISAAAVTRWTERVNELPPKNQVESFLDEYYPDNRMKETYPTMKIVYR